MAVITKTGTPSCATRLPAAENTLTGKVAGEAITAGDPCYVAGSTVMRSLGVAANAAAYVDGFADVDAQIGDAVTLFRGGVMMRWGAGLTPGTDLYLGVAAGTLDTAATTGGLVPVARTFDATTIRCFGNK